MTFALEAVPSDWRQGEAPVVVKRNHCHFLQHLQQTLEMAPRVDRGERPLRSKTLLVNEGVSMLKGDKALFDGES